jgi:dCTP deaminase
MQAGILSGRAILRAVKEGDIQITPFDPKRMNPASFDLTLGREVAVYKDTTHADFGCRLFYLNADQDKIVRGIPGERVRPIHWYSDPQEQEHNAQGFIVRQGPLDAAKDNEIVRYTMEDTGFILMPGVGYLMHTQERIRTDKYVPIIDGKSSIGRLFCFVHVTAGYGDPGFDGQYTLEVAVFQPLVVYPGMRFCQIRFHTIVGEVDSYQKSGNYKGELAEGPVPSRSWKMFHAKDG